VQNNQKIINTSNSVFKGGFLAPKLFKIYLNKKLRDDPLFRKKIVEKNLQEFVDDLVIIFIEQNRARKDQHSL
jgi:hypothetical protein